MQFLTVAFAALASAAVVERGAPSYPAPSHPSGGSPPASTPATPPTSLRDFCPGIDQPFCCKTDVLGLASLSCDYPSRSATSFAKFQADCASRGEQAKCCTLSLGGLGSLLCDDIPRP